MKKVFFPVLGLLLSCCSPLYVPNLHNAPLFTKAGEFQGAMQYGSSGLDLQAAVAVTNNIALMGNYSYQNVNQDTSSSSVFNKDYYHNQTYYEAALGYYKNEGKLCYEIFAGYGKGEASNYDSYSFFNNQFETVKGKYYRVFIQPSIGLNKQIVHLAFSTRISMVDFTEFSNATGKSVIINKEPKVFLEPGVTARFNFLDNRLFATVQGGFSATITNDPYYKSRWYTLGTGIGFRLGGLRRSATDTTIKNN